MNLIKAIVNHTLIQLSVCFLAGLLFASPLFAAEYWVSTAGNDDNNCTDSQNSACQTIQKGVSLLQPGDTLNVKAGTYSDDGGNSQYAPANTYCAWLGGDPASSTVCINTNGTPDKPIIIQAAPGDEGQVVIDSQGSRLGFHLQNSDYVHVRSFKFINTSHIAIASWGQVENAVADESRLSIGVVVENNEIDGVTGGLGKNVSGIGMWGTKDWIVRNNRIRNITVASGTNASGIQSYGVINALVEHNQISNAIYGIFWKDHFVKDLETRTPLFESEVRYNRINASDRGIYVGIKGANTVESGNNYFHHNIIYGYSNAGIAVGTSAGFALSGTVRLEHNLLDGIGGGHGISVDSSSGITLNANIFLRNTWSMEFIAYSNPVKRANLLTSDYNFFGGNAAVITGRYSSNQALYRNLEDWQEGSPGDFLNLTTSRADTNSRANIVDGVFADINSNNYRYTDVNALSLMPDGSRVGPYQNGNEVIGLLPRFPAYSALDSLSADNRSRPLPPSNFTITVQ